MKYNIETAREALAAFPPNGTFGLLTTLLRRESAHEEAIAGLCVEAYKNADRAPFLLHTLEDLATRNERRCGEFRAILDELHVLCRTDAPAGGRQYAIPLMFPSIDIGYDVDVSYDEGSNTLQVLMPELLPLKTTGAEFLPAKVQRAMRQFDTEHRQNGGDPIRISPAFVLFVHHYDAQRREQNHFRDYDNLEWKCVLDALQTTHMFSDSASEMILMQMAVPDERSFSEFVIAPVARMPELLQSLDLSLYDRPTADDESA